MGLLNVIRRLALSEKLPIREIARSLAVALLHLARHLKNFSQ
jgi:hypothetical protein